MDFPYWTQQLTNFLHIMESLEIENSELHAEVTVKQLVFELKNQENVHLQNPLGYPLALHILDIKHMQEE
jgi:hypothetical protein